MVYFAENKETKEVYECNRDKLIADIQSEKCVDADKAFDMLIDASISNPIELHDCFVWSEI